MSENKETSSRKGANAFIDYRLAELRIGNDWIVVYYAMNPIKNQLERFRVIIPKNGTTHQRKQYANTVCLKINQKLQAGWLPYHGEVKNEEFKTFNFCVEKFITQTKEDVKNAIKRPDTLRYYTSFFSMINKYKECKKVKLDLLLEFNQQFVVNYLDWIYFERKNTPRTYNNHFAFSTEVNICLIFGWFTLFAIRCVKPSFNQP